MKDLEKIVALVPGDGSWIGREMALIHTRERGQGRNCRMVLVVGSAYTTLLSNNGPRILPGDIK